MTRCRAPAHEPRNIPVGLTPFPVEVLLHSTMDLELRGSSGEHAGNEANSLVDLRLCRLEVGFSLVGTNDGATGGGFHLFNSTVYTVCKVSSSIKIKII